MNFDDMRDAYLRALNYQELTPEQIQNENDQLKREIHALQDKNDRIVSLLQSALDGALRISREGKSDT